LARWVRALNARDPVAALFAVTPPAFGDAVLAPELVHRFCGLDDAPLWPPLRGDVRSRRRSGLEIASRWDRLGYLPADLLPKLDVATLAAGVEARCPYLEAAFEDPPFGDPTHLGKWRLREAFAAELPAEVLRLPKTGFALPLDRWFRGELPWLDLLAEPRTQQRPHLRPGGVERAVDLHRSGRVNLGHGLYLLVAYETFLRVREARGEGKADSVPTGTRARS
jgi:hypothetical protein